jgi:hypothetical protein
MMNDERDRYIPEGNSPISHSGANIHEKAWVGSETVASPEFFLLSALEL